MSAQASAGAILAFRAAHQRTVGDQELGDPGCHLAARFVVVVEVDQRAGDDIGVEQGGQVVGALLGMSQLLEDTRDERQPVLVDLLDSYNFV